MRIGTTVIVVEEDPAAPARVERHALGFRYATIQVHDVAAAHRRIHRDAPVAHAQFHHWSAGGEIRLDVERMVGVGGAGGGRPDAVDVGEALVFQGAHYRS